MKIIPLLNLFSKHELRTFKKTFFLTEKEKKFLEVYENQIKREKCWNEEKAINQVLGLPVMKHKSLFSKLKTDLIKKVQDFLVLKEAKENNDGFYKNMLLAKAINNRQEINGFEALIEKMEKNLNQLPQETSVFLRKFLIYDIQYFNPSKHDRHSNEQQILFQKLLENFNLTLVSYTFRLEQECFTRNKNFIKEPKMTHLREFKQHISPTEAKRYQVFKIFDKIDQVQKKQHPDYKTLSIVDQLIELMSSEKWAIGLEDSKHLAHNLINFLLVNVREGKKGYREKVVQLYKVVFDKRWLSKGKYLNTVHFLNFAMIAGGLPKENLQGVKQFIDANIVNLNPKNKEKTGILAQAFLDFYQKDYSAVHKKLHLRIKNKVFIAIDDAVKARTLLIRAHYEMELTEKGLPIEVDDFTALLGKYRVFLQDQKDKLDKESYEGINNFFKVLKAFYDNKQFKPLRITREYLENEPNLPCRAWLITKYNEL